MRFVKNKSSLLLISFILIGSLLRLYNLTWGAPYYFHPDERNIIYSVTQLVFPTNFHPDFFAYGSLPIYAIFFTGMYSQLFLGNILTQIPFENAVFISRIFSALFSISLIPLLYLLGKKIKDTNTGILAAGLGTFNVGLIQFAHFGTFEMWLTLGSLLLFLACLSYLHKQSYKTVWTIGILFGILISVKVSSLVFVPLLFLVLLLPYTISVKSIANHAGAITKGSVIIFFSAFLVYLLTNVFVFLDFPAFNNSMSYESSVAIGTLPVFYTGEFVHTTPVLYPFLRVYPFLINPVMLVLFFPAFIALSALIFKEKNKSLMLLLAFFLLLFLSQAFLFVKWTRYYVPTIPFMLLILSYGITTFFNKKKSLSVTATVLLFFVSAVFALSYVITAFVEKDSRLQAFEFAKRTIPEDKKLLSESYDLGIVPFNEQYRSITLIDFYSLDTENSESEKLTDALAKTDVIILPSQRLVKTRLQNQTSFPTGYAFYKKLFDGTLGYELTYKTPCSIFCHITYLSDPVYAFEGTANIFDRPTVYIFQKHGTD